MDPLKTLPTPDVGLMRGRLRTRVPVRSVDPLKAAPLLDVQGMGGRQRTGTDPLNPLRYNAVYPIGGRLSERTLPLPREFDVGAAGICRTGSPWRQT